MNHTYRGDDSSSKEEGTPQVPVTGIVGCVSNRTHSCTHGVYGMLKKEYVQMTMMIKSKNLAHITQQYQSLLKLIVNKPLS